MGNLKFDNVAYSAFNTELDSCHHPAIHRPLTHLSCLSYGWLIKKQYLHDHSIIFHFHHYPIIAMFKIRNFYYYFESMIILGYVFHYPWELGNVSSGLEVIRSVIDCGWWKSCSCVWLLHFHPPHYLYGFCCIASMKRGFELFRFSAFVVTGRDIYVLLTRHFSCLTKCWQSNTVCSIQDWIMVLFIIYVHNYAHR